MKILLFILGALFTFQIALAQDKKGDTIAISNSTILISQKADKQKFKLQKDRKYQLKSAEKAKKKAKKAQKSTEKKFKKAKKLIAKRASAQEEVENTKNKIIKLQRNWNRDQQKHEKLKKRGSISDTDELKWNQKVIKYQSKTLKLDLELEKAETKLRKL